MAPPIAAAIDTHTGPRVFARIHFHHFQSITPPDTTTKVVHPTVMSVFLISHSPRNDTIQPA